MGDAVIHPGVIQDGLASGVEFFNVRSGIVKCYEEDGTLPCGRRGHVHGHAISDFHVKAIHADLVDDGLWTLSVQCYRTCIAALKYDLKFYNPERFSLKSAAGLCNCGGIRMEGRSICQKCKDASVITSDTVSLFA